ncbi:ESX secretion-associated protein EspG [Actinophytocola glycyrrhizae]|uniref:ESX secretion-associated protein EspG n=1 Tax=Actinophytocola glycyrrhizae TaxID=2044873 RepID=A0ABV9S1B4_9PSEU
MSATSLSHQEFDLLWEHLGFTERPYPLDVRSFGYTMDERAALRDQVRESLLRKGLHDGAEVAPVLEEQLSVLGRHTFGVDGRLSVGEPLRVLAASDGRRGVLAAQSDDEVRLAWVRDARLVPAVIALLPDHPPGPGGVARLPKQVFDAAVDEFAASGYVGLERVLAGGGVTGRDLRTVVTLLESGRRGGGQLAANSVDQVGRRTRTPVLNWFDTEPGRYLVHSEVTMDRVEWVIIAPADTARVGQRLSEMADSLNQP